MLSGIWHLSLGLSDKFLSLRRKRAEPPKWHPLDIKLAGGTRESLVNQALGVGTVANIGACTMLFTPPEDDKSCGMDKGIIRPCIRSR